VAKYSGAATHAFCAAVSLRQKTLNLRIGWVVGTAPALRNAATAAGAAPRPQRRDRDRPQGTAFAARLAPRGCTNPSATPAPRRYGDLLQAMHDELRQDRRFLDQTPTLSSSTTIDCWKVKMTM
jgi:hypothetical protein